MLETPTLADLNDALQRERRARELLQRIAVVSSSGVSVPDAILATLRAVCDYSGWPLGHAYMLAGDRSGALVPSDLWHLDLENPSRFETFRAITRQTRFAPGVGLPGRVLAAAAPLWIMDVREDPNFPRARAATDIGIAAAFAFPVLGDGRVVAVLEFFSDRALEPDLPMLEVMGSAGLQLGNLIERKRTEEALAESELRFRSVAQSANDAVISANRRGEIISWNGAARRMFGYSEDEAVGQPLELIIPEMYRDAHRHGMRRLQETGVTRAVGSTVELEGLRRDRNPFPIELSLAMWNIGDEPFYTGIIRDITERRLAEAKLRAFAETVDRKNDELARQHAELEKSHAELLRSIRQAEQIFSAYLEVLPGSELDGKYRLESRIGSGGFGVVYRARHLHLHRTVAVKIFRPASGAATPEQLARFRREGISACLVNHSNAVSVLDSGVSSGGIPYLVMELLEGHSLAAEIQARGRLPVSRAVEIAATVCDVLTTAHASGIVHRDIKPDNVFLQRVGTLEVVKVLDFGIARLADDLEGGMLGRLTSTGQMIGTPVYMSPERLRGEPHDGRADVYSLGIMLYEMLAGRPPFRSISDGPWDLIQQHLTYAPPSLRRLNGRVPEALEALVHRALAKEPEARPLPQELAGALSALRGALSHEPVAAVDAPEPVVEATLDPLMSLEAGGDTVRLPNDAHWILEADLSSAGPGSPAGPRSPAGPVPPDSLGSPADPVPPDSPREKAPV